eukprot:6521723-Heterocapsa_arctica.AAC.1
MGSMLVARDGGVCRWSPSMHLGQWRKAESPSAMFLAIDYESLCAGAVNRSLMRCPPMAVMRL